MKLSNKAAEYFGAPDSSSPILDKMLTEEEQMFLSAVRPDKDYSPREIEELFAGCSRSSGPKPQDEDTQPQDAEAKPDFPGDFPAAARLYHRGVIDPGEKDGTFRIGNFWSRLDIFATEEPELYSTIPENLRLETEACYLKRYEESLLPTDADGAAGADFRPTDDEVLPVEDVLEFIESKDEQAYLADCDCRSLRQACRAPRDLCITYRTGPYSYVRRGLAKPITKEQAKDIVLRSEEEGLIHTVNSGGICSCCTDCCYLFRAAEDIGCLGTWPKVSYRIELDEDACIGCGKCMERCRFGVFEMTACGTDEPKNSRLSITDIARCQGCGLCRSTCPAGALKLEKI